MNIAKKKWYLETISIMLGEKCHAQIQGRSLIIYGDTYTLEQLNTMEMEKNSENIKVFSLERKENASAPNTPTCQLYFEDS